MSTPYKDILDRAIFRFSDLNIARLNETDQYYVLRQFLESAVSDFQPKCKYDLSKRIDASDADSDGESLGNDMLSYDIGYNAAYAGFEEDLDAEVQEILALGVSYYWLSSKVLNSELLKNKLSTKDYQYFSPANLMREIQTLRESVRKEYRDRIVLYTYDHGDVSMEGNI